VKLLDKMAEPNREPDYGMDYHGYELYDAKEKSSWTDKVYPEKQMAKKSVSSPSPLKQSANLDVASAKTSDVSSDDEEVFEWAPAAAVEVEDVVKECSSCNRKPCIMKSGFCTRNSCLLLRVWKRMGLITRRSGLSCTVYQQRGFMANSVLATARSYLIV
jgi:hypothetical protein